MGQRHQIYLNVPNPTKVLRDVERGYGVKLKDSRIDENFRMFGATKREIILPFHNQWLFGRRAPLHALRILNHCSKLHRWSMLGNPKHYNHTKSPLTKWGIEYGYNNFSEYMNTLHHIMNWDSEGKHQDIEGLGKVSSTRFEGDVEDFKVMSKAFDLGDNNDGITIIDTITNKYCFMNINTYSYGDDELMNSASDLKPYTPVSARDYMKTYYPEAENLIPEYLVERGDATAKQLAEENLRVNLQIDKEFELYELMTMDEVKVLFPKMSIPVVKEVKGVAV